MNFSLIESTNAKYALYYPWSDKKGIKEKTRKWNFTPLIDNQNDLSSYKKVNGELKYSKLK